MGWGVEAPERTAGMGVSLPVLGVEARTFAVGFKGVASAAATVGFLGFFSFRRASGGSDDLGVGSSVYFFHSTASAF